MNEINSTHIYNSLEEATLANDLEWIENGCRFETHVNSGHIVKLEIDEDNQKWKIRISHFRREAEYEFELTSFDGRSLTKLIVENIRTRSIRQHLAEMEKQRINLMKDFCV